MKILPCYCTSEDSMSNVPGFLIAQGKGNNSKENYSPQYLPDPSFPLPEASNFRQLLRNQINRQCL